MTEKVPHRNRWGLHRPRGVSDRRLCVFFFLKLAASKSSNLPDSVMGLGTGIAFSRNGRWLATVTLDSTNIWDLQTGAKIRSFAGDSMAEAFAIDNGSRLLATADFKGQVSLWEIETGRLVHAMSTGSQPVHAIAFDKSGELLVTVSEGGELTLFNVKDGMPLHTWNTALKGSDVAITFSPDGLLIVAENQEGTVSLFRTSDGSPAGSVDGSTCGYTSASVAVSPVAEVIASACGNDLRLTSFSGEVLALLPHHRDQITSISFNVTGTRIITGSRDHSAQLWDVERKTAIEKFVGCPSFLHGVSLSPDDKWIAAMGWDGIARLWEVQTQKQVVNLLVPKQTSDWLAVDSYGNFDGTEGAWKIGMVREDRSLRVRPLESFVKTSFRPGLLSRVLQGEALPSSLDTAVNLSFDHATLGLLVLAEDGPITLPENVWRNMQKTESGGANIFTGRTFTVQVEVSSAKTGNKSIRDVRLFRNGLLVKIWRGEVRLGKDGRAVLVTSVLLPVGQNRLTAYGFDSAGLKIPDTQLSLTIKNDVKPTGILYIVSIGIDKYEWPSLDLKHAVSDARAIAGEIEKIQVGSKQFSKTVVVRLLDSDATRTNILSVLAQLSKKQSSAPRADLPEFVPNLSPAQPEDMVIIYFAGHGLGDGERLYLVPHDLGEDLPAATIRARIAAIEKHSVSDQDLEHAFEDVDAGEFALIVDACNSGRLLESKEDRVGPMNSDGLAQLAFDKGMYVLAASQSMESAIEVDQLGHGLLTYALVQEGLIERKAAELDGNVFLRRWLDYAVGEVPTLQSEWNKGKNASRAIQVEDDGGLLQHPRVFHRREQEPEPFVIGITESFK